MNRPDCYQGLPFSREEVDQLGVMLGLQSHEAACSAAAAITGFLGFCQMQIEARKSVPDVKLARRRLDRIASAAQQLEKLLSDEPSASLLMLRPGWVFQEDHIDIGKVIGDAEQRVKEMQIDLRIICANAARLADNDRDLRANYLLPSAAEAGKATPALALWPRLFEIWEHAGKRVAGTADGPLHRFLKFIHQAAGLAEPNANTFKDAVAEWKDGGSKAKVVEVPPWWNEGFD